MATLTEEGLDLVDRLRSGHPIYCDEVDAATLANEQFERERSETPTISVAEIVRDRTGI